MVRPGHTTATVESVSVTSSPPTGAPYTDVTLDLDRELEDGFRVRWMANFSEVQTASGVVARISGDTLTGGGFEPGVHYEFIDIDPATFNSQAVLRFFNAPGQALADNAANLSPGQRLVLTHQKYSSNPLTLEDCIGVEIRDVHFGDAAGMGLISFDCENFTALRVTSAARSGNLYSLTADGLNHHRPRGNFTFTDCHFSRLGDDAFNLHSTWYRSVALLDGSGAPQEIAAGVVTDVLYMAEGHTAFEVSEPPLGAWILVDAELSPLVDLNVTSVAAGADGDPVEGLDSVTICPGTYCPDPDHFVDSVQYPEFPRSLWKVTLGHAVTLPSVGDGLVRAVPRGHVAQSVLVDGCSVRESRVRGALISVPNVEVRDSTFEILAGPALALPSAQAWWTGTSSSRRLRPTARIRVR